MSRRLTRVEPKQPPVEQPVQIEVFRNLSTGGRVGMIVELPGEQFFRDAREGDTLPCTILTIQDTTIRTARDQQ